MRSASGKREPNPLTALSRWKLFDNLRRSVVPVMLTTMLLVCWALMPNTAFWTTAVLSVIFLPTLISAIWDLAENRTTSCGASTSLPRSRTPA
ncbi:hypothetical protein LP419_17090 [Massilia sp. H-1]|nr:hypothetical protein LP419_17090 [Massilia sp. H-1]